MQKILNEFIKYIEDEKFKEAHECLEGLWKEYKKSSNPLSNLLKGYINGASAFELIRRGNIKGAKTLWKVYLKYLPLKNENIEGYELFCKADKLLENLAKERLPL